MDPKKGKRNRDLLGGGRGKSVCDCGTEEEEEEGKGEIQVWAAMNAQPD
jgi:hypothetical protein